MTTTETNVRRGDIIRVTSLPSSEPLKIGDLPTDALAPYMANSEFAN